MSSFIQFLRCNECFALMLALRSVCFTFVSVVDDREVLPNLFGRTSHSSTNFVRFYWQQKTTQQHIVGSFGFHPMMLTICLGLYLFCQLQFLYSSFFCEVFFHFAVLLSIFSTFSVEMRGLEPLASALQRRRSPSWATSPGLDLVWWSGPEWTRTTDLCVISTAL